MYKNVLFIFLTLFLLQSCSSYKTTVIGDIKVGKTYEVLLKNEQKIEAICEGVKGNLILFNVNGNLVEFPNHEVLSMKRKKISVLKVAGGLAIATIGAILILNKGKKEILQLN